MDKFDNARENLIRSGFLSADTEAYIHRKRISHSAQVLFRIAWMEKYTQNDVALSILASIHVNTVDYILSECKQ